MKSKNNLFLWIITLPFYALSRVIFSMISEYLVDHYQIISSYSMIIKYSLFVIVICIIMAVGQSINKNMMYKCIQYYMTELKKKVFTHYLYQNNTTNLVSKITNQMDIIEKRYYEPLFELITQISIFSVSLIVLFCYSKAIAIFLFAVALITMAIGKGFTYSLQTIIEKQNELVKKYTVIIQDSIYGKFVLQLHQGIHYMLKRLQDHLNNVYHNQIKITAYSELISNISQYIMVISSLIYTIYGMYLVSINQMTIGTLLAISTLSSGVIKPVSTINSLYLKMTSSKSLKKSTEQLKTSQNNSTCIGTFQTIRLDNISLMINQHYLFQNLSLTLKEGHKYKIIGENGSWKSTLLKVILNLIPIHQGQILFNEEAVNFLNPTLFTYIPNNAFLYNETILWNITLGQDIPISKIKDCLKWVHLPYDDEFLNKEVSIGATNLSSGQRQKIAIARAYLLHRPIMILDEAFNTIDIESKKCILEKLMSDNHLTLLMVDHYDSNIYTQSDIEIIHLSNGGIL